MRVAGRCSRETICRSNGMSPEDRKRNYWKDLLLASMLVATGLVISTLSLNEIARNPQVLAQATQPLQSTPGAESKPAAPADPVFRRGNGSGREFDRHPAFQRSTRACAARRRRTEGGCPTRAAACAGGKNRAADQGSVALSVVPLPNFPMRKSQLQDSNCNILGHERDV